MRHLSPLYWFARAFEAWLCFVSRLFSFFCDELSEFVFFSSKEDARKKDKDVKYRISEQYMEVENNCMKEEM